MRVLYAQSSLSKFLKAKSQLIVKILVNSCSIFESNRNLETRRMNIDAIWLFLKIKIRYRFPLIRVIP